MAQVDLNNLTKVYDDAQGTEVAVRELDLNIEDGEFIVFVGPSGCGKSTTLRMIAGLESITDGDVLIDDEIVNEKPPKSRDIAMVFQNYALYPHMTVRENMGYGLKLSTDLSSEEIEKRVEETAEMMGIEDLLDKKPSALSGGQQQRVATGRSIVREPAVFLFDEPLSNLDAKLRKHMRTELARLHNELQITTIYVTHDQEEAMTMADRIVVLDDGELQQVGTPKEVYYQPANLFVADFIGSPSMNFFNVDLETHSDGSGSLIHDGGGFEYGISEEITQIIDKQSEGTSLVLGVRPENVRIDLDGSAPEEKRFSAPVEVVEVVGSDNFIYVDIEGEELRLRSPPQHEPEVGSEIYLTFDEADMHVFDAQTEQAITHGGERTLAELAADSGTKATAEQS